MRLLQGVRHLEHEPDGHSEWKLHLSSKAITKALALDIGHRVPELPGVMAGVEDRKDVGVLQLRREA